MYMSNHFFYLYCPTSLFIALFKVKAGGGGLITSVHHLRILEEEVIWGTA